MLNSYWLPTGFSSCYCRKCLFKGKKAWYTHLSEQRFFWPQECDILLPPVSRTGCAAVLASPASTSVPRHASRHLWHGRLISSSHWAQHNSLGPGISLPFKHQPEQGCSVGPHSKGTQLLTKLAGTTEQFRLRKLFLYQLWGIYFYLYLLIRGGMK